MAPKPSKIAKTDSGKLWTHEDRMFSEKFIYLDKSAVVGLEPQNFEALVRICDRATGSYITIKRMDFDDFTEIVSSIVNGTYKITNKRIDGPGINFYYIGNDMWKLAHASSEYISILVHKSSLKSFTGIAELIKNYIDGLDPAFCLRYLDELRENIVGMDGPAVMGYLYGKLDTFGLESAGYQLLFDLISNRESYIALQEFNEGFYNIPS